MSSVLGVIPARGGSNRVPRKNIREVGGRPLIAYSIEQASNADRLDKTVVSTEDEEIKQIAREHGGRVPFDRPPELATDTATNNEVVTHALDWFDADGNSFDTVCLVSVTTPFRTSEDIDRALEKLATTDAQSVVSISEFDDPPYWAVETDAEGFLGAHFDDAAMWGVTRTQEVQTLHHPNSSVYGATVDAFRSHGSFYTDRTIGYEMPRERSLDIDEPFDLRVARALMETNETR